MCSDETIIAIDEELCNVTDRIFDCCAGLLSDIEKFKEMGFSGTLKDKGRYIAFEHSRQAESKHDKRSDQTDHSFFIIHLSSQLIRTDCFVPAKHPFAVGEIRHADWHAAFGDAFFAERGNAHP